MGPPGFQSLIGMLKTYIVTLYKKFGQELVSIPHRYAENGHSGNEIGGGSEFQSLIGMLKTRERVSEARGSAEFQSLIGMLKTVT